MHCILCKIPNYAHTNGPCKQSLFFLSFFRCVIQTLHTESDPFIILFVAKISNLRQNRVFKQWRWFCYPRLLYVALRQLLIFIIQCVACTVVLVCTNTDVAQTNMTFFLCLTWKSTVVIYSRVKELRSCRRFIGSSYNWRWWKLLNCLSLVGLPAFKNKFKNTYAQARTHTHPHTYIYAYNWKKQVYLKLMHRYEVSTPDSGIALAHSTYTRKHVGTLNDLRVCPLCHLKVIYPLVELGEKMQRWSSWEYLQMCCVNFLLSPWGKRYKDTD